MAHITADRVRETSTTTGTGAFTLAGAVQGFRAFSAVLAVNDTCYYTIADLPGTNWEVGIGTYSAASTLTRTTVLSSSNAGAAVTFGAGTKDVFITAAAGRFLQADSVGSYGNFSAGTITASLTGTVSTPNGASGIFVGDDVILADRNVANTLFVSGNQNSDRGYINFSTSSANSLGAIAGGALTWNGNTIWHAGNDGTTSGLDADLLDGNHSTAFAAAVHNHTSLTGVTSIGFASDASDTASLSTTINANGTYFDFNLSDDNNNDWWRWRFTPSGSTVYDAMTLKPSANGIADLTVSGKVFVSSDGGFTNQNNGNSGIWYGRILSRNSTSDKAAFLGTYGSVGGVFAHNNALSAWSSLNVNTITGSAEGGDVLIAGSGSVGIGTSTLNGKFIVSGGTLNTTTYTSSEARISDGSIHLMKTVAGGVFEAVRAMNVDTTAGTTVRVLGAATSDPFNNTNGGKVFIDAVRTTTNMDLLFSLNDVAGAAPVERVRFMGNGNVGIGTNSPGYKLQVNGSFAATTKSFLIDHPTKPGMKLRYGSLEGPENGVYVRGKLEGDVIELPDYWSKLVDPDSITVQLTPIGKHQKLYVKDIKDNKVYVGVDGVFSSPIKCFYYVLAERCDVEKLITEID